MNAFMAVMVLGAVVVGVYVAMMATSGLLWPSGAAQEADCAAGNVHQALRSLDMLEQEREQLQHQLDGGRGDPSVFTPTIAGYQATTDLILRLLRPCVGSLPME